VVSNVFFAQQYYFDLLGMSKGLMPKRSRQG
jgi:hypothetical protein